MHALALLAAAAATVSPQPRLDDGAARFSIRLDNGVERVRSAALAPPRRTAIGGYLNCSGDGTSVVYGTAGSAVRRASAVLADGRRVRLTRRAAPARWRYGGAVFTRVLRARVSIMEVRGYDRAGHRITRRLYTPATPCVQARPPEPAPGDRVQIDPDVRTGAEATRVAQAEAAWRRAAIFSYDLQVRTLCFCPPPAGEWRTSRVRDGVRRHRSMWTVPELFRVVRREIESRPASLKVTYGRYGVPRAIDVDQRLDVADDEFAVTTRRFRVR